MSNEYCNIIISLKFRQLVERLKLLFSKAINQLNYVLTVTIQLEVHS